MTLAERPADLDIALYRGDTPRWSVVLPWDLTGGAVRLQVRDARDRALVSLSSLAGGGLFLEPNAPAAGSSRVRMRALTAQEEAAVVAAESPAYDLEARFAGGQVWTVLRGRFAVARDVTRMAPP